MHVVYLLVNVIVCEMNLYLLHLADILSKATQHCINSFPGNQTHNDIASATLLFVLQEGRNIIYLNTFKINFIFFNEF